MAAPLSVVVAHRPPFVFVDNTTKEPSRYMGMLIDLLPLLVERAGLSERGYQLYESELNAGGALVNGTWTGIMGEVVEGPADMALFPLTRNLARGAFVDMTYSYHDSGLSLLVKHEMEQPGPLSVLAPFTGWLWIWLLITVFVVAMIFWALDIYALFWERRHNRDQLKQVQQGKLARTGSFAKRLQRKITHIKGSTHFMSSWQTVAGVPEPTKSRGWSVQILQICYCFFAMIVLAAYTANLTSFLSSTSIRAEVTGLQSLLRDNQLLGVNPGGSTAGYFINSADTLATQLQPNIRACSTEQCLEWLEEGYISAFVTDRPVIEYIAGMAHPCNLKVAGEVFGPGNLVIALKKNSTLTPLINDALQRLSEDGMLTMLTRKWFDDARTCKELNLVVTVSETDKLGVNSLMGCFFFLCGGVVVAFLVANIEVMIKVLKAPDAVKEIPKAIRRASQAGTPPGSGRLFKLGPNGDNVTQSSPLPLPLPYGGIAPSAGGGMSTGGMALGAGAGAGAGAAGAASSPVVPSSYGALYYHSGAMGSMHAASSSYSVSGMGGGVGVADAPSAGVSDGGLSPLGSPILTQRTQRNHTYSNSYGAGAGGGLGGGTGSAGGGGGGGGSGPGGPSGPSNLPSPYHSHSALAGSSSRTHLAKQHVRISEERQVLGPSHGAAAAAAVAPTAAAAAVAAATDAPDSPSVSVVLEKAGGLS